MITTTLKLEGMMCEGCEKRVQNVLKDIEEITSVTADHKTKKVIVTSDKEISTNIIKEKIEDLGFELIEEE